MADKNGNTNTNSQPPRMPQPPMRNIDFQVDSVSVEMANHTGAYQDHDANSITSNFIKGHSEWNEWAQGDNVLVHEQKHRDNNNQGMYEYPVSPEQAYKLNMYDEISANMASLLLLRQKYLETGDISIFDKADQGRFRFYKEAIEKGEINPRSNVKEDFDKEMRLISNGTKDMWMRDFAPTETYINCGASSASYYSDRTEKYAQYYDQNYERGQKIALTVGGVDFSQYLDNDVEIPEAGRKKIEDLSKDISYTSANNADDLKNLSNQELTQKFNIPAYDGSMSLQQYQDYLQHYFMSESLNPAALQNIENDKSALEAAKQVGTENIKANEALINLAVTSAAQDYAKNGDKLPEANDEAYNNAVNKLYEVEIGEGENSRKVNIRQDLGLDDKDFNDNLPITSLSEDAKEIVSENSSFWNRMKTKCNNLWDKVKSKFSDDDDEFEDGDASDWVENAKKNEPINITRKNKTPVYRQWEDKDGSRVSEVQHIRLLDMTKDVIQKPSKYNVENKTLNTEDTSREKMCAIIDYMNKINGQDKTIDTEKTVENLCKTYGNNALLLLQTAVNEPANYAKYVGDVSIKTSRAAVQHLSNIKEPEKAAQEITQRKVSSKYESSVKEQLKQAAASRVVAKPKMQKLGKPLKQQMSEDAKKYQTQKKVRRHQQQKTTAPSYDNTVKNDNIPTRQMIAPDMRIMQLRGIKRSAPAKKVVKRELGKMGRKQRVND